MKQHGWRLPDGGRSQDLLGGVVYVEMAANARYITFAQNPSPRSGTKDSIKIRDKGRVLKRHVYEKA